jgi:hypothetical protein
MADFEYIHKHPWLTVGAIAGGGFILFLLIHKRSVSADQSGAGVAAGAPAGVDPNIAAQVNMQAAQIQGNLAGLSISGQTQLGLAQIGAGVQSQGIGASQDITNRQTDAQVRLGLGTLDAQVEAERINAAIQMKTIDAIMFAFSGNHPITNPTPTVTTPVANNTNNPISTINAPQTVYPVSPGYNTPGGPTGTGSGMYAPGTAGGGSVVPGGTQLVPYPTYMHSDPGAYPGMAPGAICSPLDANCVETNAALSNQWHADTAAAQDRNNLTQLVMNYQQSVAAGTITPQQSAELAQYSNQLAAMGGTVPTVTMPTPARVFPSQVNAPPPVTYPISDTAATLAAYSGRGAAGARGR